MPVDMAAALVGPRSPSWQVWLCDTQDRPIRQLTAVADGSIELSATDRLGGRASLSIDQHAAEQIDWLRDRIRLRYDPGVDGVDGWDMGIWLPSSPTFHHDLVSSWAVELQSKMVILDEATTQGSYCLPVGSNLVAAAAELIRTTGETRIAVTPSLSAAREAIAFPAGESVLTVVNTLLEAANYWGCYVDGTGQFVLAPYQPPAARGVAWRFAAGQTAIHSPQWDRTVDQTSVPNRVEVYTAGSDEADPIIGVAENTDPTSPYSYAARARWVTRREQVEAASQTEADALAARYLLAAMSPLAKLSVSHAMVPVWPRQAVRFTADGIDTAAIVQKMSMRLAYDTQVAAEWNEVSDA